MDYQIVRYRPEFRQQVVELLGHLKGRDAAANSAYFEWKYERNPYLSPPLLFVALHDGQVAGFKTFFGLKWEAGTSDAAPDCLGAADVVVAPEHRRRGVLKKIMEHAVGDLRSQGYAYLFDISATPVNYLALLGTGWRSPGPYRTLRRDSGRAALGRKLRQAANRIPVVRRHAGNRLFPLLPGLQNPFQPLDDFAGQGTKAAGRVSTAREPRPSDMAELVARIGTDGRIRAFRDREFLTWRYQDPHYVHRFIYLEHDRLDGYLALQTRPEIGRAEATIVEWEASTPDVHEALLDAALEAGFETLSIWSATLGPENMAILRSRGFRSFDDTEGVEGYRPAMLVLALDEAKPESEWRSGARTLLNLADWDMCRVCYG